MRVKHTFLFTLLLGLGWAGFLFAYQNGPDPAVNGIFGSTNNCAQAGCHVGNPVNAPGGSLTLLGLPAEWTAGQTYPLTVLIQRTATVTYGFQLSAVFDSNSQQAGSLTKGGTGVAANRISIVSAGGVQYAQHNQVNAQSAATTQFLVNWTAPSSTSGGTVRFNVAANAANGNIQNTGDFIYTLVERRSPGAGPAPDFSMTATPATAAVTAGQSASYTTSIAGGNGFAGSVALSVTGLPSGATGSFNPASVTGGGDSTLTISTAGTVAAGTYPLTITGVSGSVTHSASVSLSVSAAAPADFSIAVNAPSVSVAAGANTTASVAVVPANGFAASVALTVTGLPAGASGSFSPSLVTASGNSTLTITVSGAVVPGTYPLVIAGTSGSLTHTAALSLAVTAPGNTSRTFAIANFSSNSSSTDGTGALGVGYARISATTGTAPAGVEIFGYRANNVLVGETGVPASPLIASGRIYAEVGGAVNTGLAIANPGTSTATINFFFTNASGADFGSGSTTIPAGGQLAKFLNETPFSGGSNVQGTFSFTSTLPVSVIALRGFTNEVRNDFLITTLPVIDTSAAAGTGTQILPHFANGGGWTTQVILVNPGSTTLTGTLQFVSTAGVPVTVVSNPNYSVPPRSSQKLVTSGPEAYGSVRVQPSSGGAAPVPLVVFSYKPGGITLTEAGAPANAGTAFRMYVESSGTSGQPGNIQSGIAVANGGATAASVTFELFKADGTSAGLTRTIPIAPSGQYASFLAEIFRGTLPQPFSGVLRISAPSSISVVGLRGRYNERSEFLITTTPPALESAAASGAELLFPHLVNGGGYTTQFILFSGTAGQTSAGTLRFFNQNGAALSLILNQ